ncbi:MAG: 1,4-dihydroxy-2-naphthoate polyprenyltransferase [Rhodanobacter sp.]|jgi:1,4-dihydroxy-2-naphthoate octaprenyltransferase|nr:1,4-dihydroxy-2-naphthoate polyprenyltransferase [Rhodanobacter sp.]
MDTAKESPLPITRHTRTRVWLHSLRPRTLPLSCAAIVSGSALAVWQHGFSLGVALLALATATLLQILSNLANDYGDVRKGADTVRRIGPLRGLHTGAITLMQMRRALWLCGLLAALCGCALIAIAVRDPGAIAAFALLGLLSIAAALGYTLGRHAYGYLGLGDAAVLVFFGWVGVAGSYALQTGHLDAIVFWPATASGLLAAAVLNINNLRDIESDPLAGKKTLAVRLGPQGARRYHVLLLAGALLCLALFAAFVLQHWSGWLFLLSVPSWIRLALQVLREPSTQAMQPLLASTVRAVLLAHLLFVVGLLWA